jgi:hypothetical protein
VLCLTIRQPWAAAVLAGLKAVENRSWSTRHRGPLLIHAARAGARHADCIPWPELDPEKFVYGAVLGVVGLIECRPTEAGFDWLLGSPWRFPSPLPCCGRLGLFDVPDALVLPLLAAPIGTAPTPGREAPPCRS